MILTFNKSSSDKKGLNENFDPCQIMVTQRKYLNTEIVNSFIEAEKEHKILIHTSYVTKVFSPNAINYLSKVRKNLSEYILVAKKIKTKYVLIFFCKHIFCFIIKKYMLLYFLYVIFYQHSKNIFLHFF